MKRCVRILMIAGLLTGWLACLADAEVVIKVRALNPLDTKETAVINYPLPREVTKADILKQNITYSMDHSEDEEPPKNKFQISFDEERGEHYVDESIVLFPKEVVTLEVHVKDVWVIEESQIEQLKENVLSLLKDWDQHSEVMAEEIADGSSEVEETPENTKDIIEDENVKDGEDELEIGDEGDSDEETEEGTKEFALVMKEEILKGLDDILKRQNENNIISVGVERHIAAFEENMDAFTQVQQDIILLANLIQFDIEENEETLEEELPEENDQDSDQNDDIANEKMENAEITEETQDLE